MWKCHKKFGRSSSQGWKIENSSYLEVIDWVYWEIHSWNKGKRWSGCESKDIEIGQALYR